MALLAPMPVVLQHDSWSCGRACVQAVLLYLGIHADPADLARELGTEPTHGTHPVAIVRLLTAYQLQVSAVHGLSIADLAAAVSLDRPVLCPVQRGGGHWVVVHGVGRHVRFMDPLTGHARSLRRPWLAGWHDDALGVEYRRYGIVVGR